MNPISPKIDRRTFQELLQKARSIARFYTPEWEAQHEKDPGVALLKIFLNMHEQVIRRLNEVPHKNLVAFLDMMGIQMRPAQSAVAPVTFSLAEGTALNVLVPRGTELAGEAVKENQEKEEILFRTEDNLLASFARLQEIFSVDAPGDRFYKHSEDFLAGTPFTIFSGAELQEHSLYLGHEDLLNQNQPAVIRVNFTIASGATESDEFQFAWEFWNGENWVELASSERRNFVDLTDKFRRSGVMEFTKPFSGEIKSAPLFEQTSRWIRCRLSRPLSLASRVQLPTLNLIQLSVKSFKPFLPDLAFNNDIPLEISPIDVPMLAKDIPVEIDRSQACPGDQTGLIPDDLEIEDTLEFNNRVDDPIRSKIVPPSIPPTSSVFRTGKCYALDPPVNLYINDITVVRMITAMRSNDLTVAVLSENVAGLNIGAGIKAYLMGEGDPQPLYVASITPAGDPTLPANEQRHEITFDQGAGSFYNEDDQVRILPAIKPFGELPRLFDTFNLASDEAFSKKGARVTIHIESEWHDYPATPPDPDPQPVLSWEYWNGESWRGLRVSDTTEKFKAAGQIRFTCPEDIEKIEVNGEEKYWIRARLIDGDYGKEIIIGSGGTVSTGTIYYPVIKEINIEYQLAEQAPQFCFTLNNLDYIDRTAECRDKDLVFDPFAIFPEIYPGIFLGFDQPLTGGPLRMLIDLEEQFLGSDERLKMLWFYWNGREWVQLNVFDETENLTRVGMLEWIGGADFAVTEMFDRKLYWLKGLVVEGIHPSPPTIKGIFLNSVYALQAASIEGEILGSGDATAKQSFQLLHPLVIAQQVWIKEAREPGEEEMPAIIAAEGEDAVEKVLDETGEVQEIWVRWHEVEDFDQSDSSSRHYTVDKRLGIVRFGDGEQGMVCPAGDDNVMADYQFGGGKIGNVPPLSVKALKNAIPFIQAVTNYLDADAGAETETLEEAIERGTHRLQHRDRAVAAADFEWLARDASRKVARAKCLPNTDASGEFAPGWVTVLIVPDSKEKQPQPTRQLIKTVSEGLEQSAANLVVAPKHIHVRGPLYTEVIVETTIVPIGIEVAAEVESAARETLNRYIHPLTGGAEQTGWEFGKAICLSDIISRIEHLPNVDYVASLVLYAGGVQQAGDVALDPFTLPVSGEHRINLALPANTVTTATKKDECEYQL